MSNKRIWPKWLFWLAVFFLGVLISFNNALTTAADLARNQIAFKTWHPYVWEYSSFLSSFVLYFGMYWLANKAHLFSGKWVKNLVIHLLATVVFSIMHVFAMVWLRQIIYMMMGGQYEFGDWLSEWLYEYRKDVISYFIFLLTCYAFQYFTQPKNKPTTIDETQRIQVKNKHGVFWLKHTEIATIESGGNYVYVHANDQVLPMRSTMSEMEQQLSSACFIRVHRSYLVNLTHCKAMRKPSPDSSELVLLSEKVVPVSKKYRADLVAALEKI